MDELPRQQIKKLPVLENVDLARLEADASIHKDAVWARKDDIGLKSFKSQIKTFYYHAQNRRCCYCSFELTTSQRTYDLEHVIDKASRSDLMFTYRNLGNSCTLCNGAKSKKRVVQNRSIIGDPFPITSGDYWIVHPHYDEWAAHFEFDEFRRVLPKAGSKKAAFTFRICGIERLNCARLADHFYDHGRDETEKLLRSIYKPNNKKRALQVEVLRKISDQLRSPIASRIIELVKKDASAAEAAPPRYISPDGLRTWKGAGKRPKWVTDHLAAGGELQELENF